MNNNKNYIIGFILIVALIVVLVWLNKDSSKDTEEMASETPTTGETNETPEEGWEDLAEVSTSGGAAARVHLAVKLNIDIRDISVIKEEAKDWGDACFGITMPGTVCAQVITPGYEVVLGVNGKIYTYRTNLTGSSIAEVFATQ